MPKTGPYLTVASFCERVLEEKDGVLTPIRLIDRIIAGATGPGVPTEMPTVRANMTLLICLKSGQARGRHTILVQPEAPSGQKLPEFSFAAQFEGADRGQNLVAQVEMNFDQEGLWWFDVILEPHILLTRVPLRLVYQPQKTSG